MSLGKYFKLKKVGIIISPGVFSNTNVELPELKTRLRRSPTFVKKTVYIHINDFGDVQPL